MEGDDNAGLLFEFSFEDVLKCRRIVVKIKILAWCMLKGGGGGVGRPCVTFFSRRIRDRFVANENRLERAKIAQ